MGIVLMLIIRKVVETEEGGSFKNCTLQRSGAAFFRSWIVGLKFNEKEAIIFNLLYKIPSFHDFTVEQQS